MRLEIGDENGNGTIGTDAIKLTDIVSIATGYDHSLALDKYGRVFAWGYGRLGALGDDKSGDNNVAPLAKQVVGVDYSSNNPDSRLKNIVQIGAAGYREYAATSFAMDREGNLYAFGRNYCQALDPSIGGDTIIKIPVNVSKNNGTIGKIRSLVADTIVHYSGGFEASEQARRRRASRASILKERPRVLP